MYRSKLIEGFLEEEYYRIEELVEGKWVYVWDCPSDVKTLQEAAYAYANHLKTRPTVFNFTIESLSEVYYEDRI